jgi:transposase
MISFEKRSQAQQAAGVVGVDAGKFKHALVVRPKGCPDSKPLAFSTTRKGFDEAVAFIASLVPAPPSEVLVGIEFAGNYGFTLAHYLHQLGFQVVSVLPLHTKRWKDVAHNLNLKTDAKDAGGIADLTWQGHFVTFPFLESRYADLRYLVSARERLQTLRKGTITRLRTVLEVVFPEFEDHFNNITDPTPLALLEAFPGPQELLKANRRTALRILRTASQNHTGADTLDALQEAASTTLALPTAQGVLKEEIALLVARHRLYASQLETIEAAMVKAMKGLPETEPLLSIPLVGPVTAAAFLGAIGNPRAYASGREILKLAGLTLTERSSGIHKGEPRISKRGRPGLRAMAYMLAVRGIAKDRMFRPEYDRLMERNGGKPHKALIAIARRALRILFSVAWNRRMWTVEPPPQRQPLAKSSERANL